MSLGEPAGRTGSEDMTEPQTCRVLGCNDTRLPGLPDCAAHAKSETCKHGNQLRYCVSCAINILNSKGFDVPMGDFVCPVCGKDFPHRHEPDDLRVRPYLQKPGAT